MQIIQLLLRYTRKITQKYRKCKYRGLHPFKDKGWRVRCIVKNLKGGRENLQSNEKVTGEVV